MSFFGNKYDADRGQTGGQYYIIGRVKSIVLGPKRAGRDLKLPNSEFSDTSLPDNDYTGPQDVGKIRYEILYSTLTTSKSGAVSEPAYPLFTFLKQYPLINEIVLIIPGPTEKLNDRFTKQQFFYFPPYSVWGSSNHGAFPNLGEVAEFRSRYVNEPGYAGSNTKAPEFPLGSTFKEKLVRNIKPFEGDTILQGRFGQSVRFGSTVSVNKAQNNWSNSGENGSPITIIVNEQKQVGLDKWDPIVENVTRDGSSIWMTSTQEINLNLSGFPLASFGVATPESELFKQAISRIPSSNEFLDANTQDKNSIGR